MSVSMKLKQLEWALGSLESFEKPKEQLEQYSTPVHLAASTLHTAQTQHGDIEGMSVLDAGCGPGILSAASGLLGAAYVLAVDIDNDALDILCSNIEELELTNIDAICCDFMSEDLLRLRGTFDTVIMNPPFGTKSSSGIDVKFLKRGLQLATKAVYSMHKTATSVEGRVGLVLDCGPVSRSTMHAIDNTRLKGVFRSIRLDGYHRHTYRDHIKQVTNSLGAKAAVVAELKYELPKTLRHHRKEVHVIHVDLWRTEPPQSD